MQISGQPSKRRKNNQKMAGDIFGAVAYNYTGNVAHGVGPVGEGAEGVAMLTELEEDALKEFFNMGIGMAANALGQMVDREILLSLPRFKMVRFEDATRLLAAHGEEKMVAVRQNFRGKLTGTALLVFPRTKGLELVATLLKEKIPLEVLTELEQETLLDMGNVILNAFLEQFTRMMDLDFEFDSAEFLRGGSAFLLNINTHVPPQPSGGGAAADHASQHAFLLIMDFNTSDQGDLHHRLNGFVILLFSQRAMAVLKHELASLLTRL